MDQEFFERRRRQSCYFWCSRISMGLTMMAILLALLYISIEIKLSISDSVLSGELANVVEQGTAAEQIAAGSVVSYDHAGNLLGGLAVYTSSSELPALGCKGLGIAEDGSCLMVPDSSSGAKVGIFILENALTSSATVSIAVQDLNGVESTNRATMSLSSIPTSTSTSVRLVDAHIGSAQYTVLLVVVVPDTTTGSSNHTFYKLSYAISSTSSTTLIIELTNVVNTNLTYGYQATHSIIASTSAIPATGFLASVGDPSNSPALLIGHTCGLNQCCLVLFDAASPATVITKKVLGDIPCPGKVVVLGGAYVAFGLNPVVVLRVHVDPTITSASSSSLKMVIHQTIYLDLDFDTEVDSLIAIQPPHPYSRFVVVTTGGENLIRTYNIIPTSSSQSSSSSLESSTLDSSTLAMLSPTATQAVALKLLHGPMQSIITPSSSFSEGDGSTAAVVPVRVEASIFVPTKLELQFVVRVGGVSSTSNLKIRQPSARLYMGKVSLQYSAFSALYHLSSVAGARFAQTSLLYYNGASGGGASSSLSGAGTVRLLVPPEDHGTFIRAHTLLWSGGFTIAGIALSQAETGQPVRVLLGGTTSIYQDLIQGQLYVSGQSGVLSPYRGDPMLALTGSWASELNTFAGTYGATTNGGFPGYAASSSNYLIVGRAESNSKLRVFLR